MTREAIAADLLHILREYRTIAPHRLRELLLVVFDGRKVEMDKLFAVVFKDQGKGKKIVTFDMKAEPPEDETLLAHLLGPTGNLRAPTLRQGKTLLVGFSEEVYHQVLAKSSK